jgi:NAD(P)-dependent dehydrogenase (short-subunit alcohol dehydrogenase family)
MVLLITGLTGIAAATAELARAKGHAVFPVGLPDVDLRNSYAADEAVRLCHQRHGRIDALFHVAGGSGRAWGDGPLHKCTDEGWRATLDANLNTAFNTTRAVLRVMLNQPPDAHGHRGAILLMSSVLAMHPDPQRFATHAYAAAKGAILSLTRSMAACYAPQKIRVNAIAPALVATPMSERAQSDPSILEWIPSKQPLSDGMLSPEAIAASALFLLSSDSRHITGQTLTVDAGWSLT